MPFYCWKYYFFTFAISFRLCYQQQQHKQQQYTSKTLLRHQMDYANRNSNNDNDNRYGHEDGRSLKDGKEVIVHLRAKQTKEYHFNIQEDDTSVWLVVTPCGGIVKWKLAQQVDDSSDDESNGEFGSGDFQLSDETNRPAVSTSTTVKPPNNAPVDPNLKRKQMMDMWTPSRKPQPNMGARMPRKESVLVREVGRGSMEYVRDSMPAGNLHLYMTATENDTTARVYVTTESKMDEFFPKLPRRKRLNLSNITTQAVVVSWDHSPSVNLYKQTDIQYCLVLSAVKYYATYCELLQDQYKTSTGTNLHKENYANFPTGAGDTGKLAPSNGGSGGVGVGVGGGGMQGTKPTVACTQYKTTYLFENLDADTKYHLSLFAVNTHTGGSVAYEGASFVTRIERQYTDTVVTLRDGRMYASYLNPAKASFRLYEYPVDHFRRQVVITVQPCTGYIRVNLYKDGQILRKSVFEELKTFVVANVKPGVLRIKVVNDDSDAKLYKIWASVRPSRNPYPRLPVDTSIKVLEHSRTCHSVTLAWLGSTEKHDYCLYKRMEEEEYFKQLILEESNQCQGPPAKMEKIFCKRFKVANDSQLIMKASVADLKPATTYRFDLYASKPNRQQLSYRTVWVKTKRDCTVS